METFLKDFETQKYNHKFYGLKENQKICGICYDIATEHPNENEIDLDMTNARINSINQPDNLQIELKDESNININGNFNDPLFNKNKSIIKRITTVKIDFPQKVVEEFEDPLICNICFDNKINELKYQKSICKHKFCNTCIVRQITTNIYSKNVFIILKKIGKKYKMPFWRMSEKI